MGWNSWNKFRTRISDQIVREIADAMVSSGMKAAGYEYINIDDGWQWKRDGEGNILPNPNFPDMKALADYVHSKGLKFGFHIMRGIPRRAVDQDLPVLGTQIKASAIANKASICRWNSDMYGVDVSKPGGQEYYDSIVKLYASWGADFLKADDMFGTGPGGDHSSEIDALSRLIDLTIAPTPFIYKDVGTYVVPGHGRLCEQMEVVDYRDMVVLVRDNVADLMKQGKTLDQIKAARPALPYESRYGSQTGPWTTSAFIEAVYKSLQAKKS